MLRRIAVAASVLPCTGAQIAVFSALVLWASSFVSGARIGDPRAATAAGRIAGLRVLDRRGEILRDPLSALGDRARWVSLEEVPAHLPAAFVAAEDGRFALHPGVDPLAVARAAAQNAARGRIVSGASTITQQLVKLTEGGLERRTVGRKLFEMSAALHFERGLSKREILEAYINWVPCGHLTRGVGMAAAVYFQKPASHLTLSESAALAALVRSPSALDPYRRPERLDLRRRWVLGRMAGQGWIGQADLEHALAAAPVFQSPGSAFNAPHLADEVLERSNRDRFASGTVQTTIDLEMQREVEHAAASIVHKLGALDVTNGAVVVIDNSTGEVLSWVGSTGYFDSDAGGMNDGVTARRSPGSALKPFVYAEALERGMTPATLLEDVETYFPTPQGPYRPENYDGKYHGPVLLRQALGSSLNVPAVGVAARLGPDVVLAALRKAGFESLEKDGSHYGAAIALGDGEVTLLELAAAYSALARGGVLRRPVLVASMRDASGRDVALEPPASRRIMDPATAYLVTSILADPAARAAGFGEARVFRFGYPVAVKTGTSHDYRDNWAVGYTTQVTVAVWVGNFDGAPMGNVSGITGAGPLLREVMEIAMKGREATAFPHPDGIVTERVCALSGALPGPGCTTTYEEVFVAGSAPTHACPIHKVLDGKVLESYPASLLSWAASVGRPLDATRAEPAGESAATIRILHPAEGAVFVLDPDVPESMQVVAVRLAAPPGAESAVLVVDGEEAAALTSPPWTLTWKPTPGEHVLRAASMGLVSEPVTIHVE